MENKWSAAELISLQKDFDKKVQQATKAYLDRGITFDPILDPLEEGRPVYTRDYSYSVMNAALCVFLNEDQDQYERINQELLANAKMYTESKHLRDDCDSFYWAAALLCRVIETYPDRLTEAVQEANYEMMWVWVYDNSLITEADYQNTKTWYVWNSENHHIQKFSTVWHFLKLLSARDEYKDRILADGHNVAEHTAAWTEYSKEWIRERGRRGLFVESGTGNYTNDTLKGICNYLDYSEDEELRRLSKEILDLYWASWAVEQLNGIRGGGKSRAYPNLHLTGADHMRRLTWYYLGIGEPQMIKGNDLVYLTCSYRMPLLIMDLALNVNDRGDYEVKNRVMGLAKDGYYQPLNYRLADEGGVLRYAYCTPDFIMGSLLVEARPEPDWTMISSQNRWQGVIFPDDVDARIHIQCEAEREPYGANRPQSQGGIMRSYNQHWTVQSKGSMITQKLKTSLAALKMQVWFAAGCMDGLAEQDGWVFAQTNGAYCGVYVISGGYYWKENEDGAPGSWLVLNDEWSPVIMEVVKKERYGSFEAFMDACRHNELSLEGSVINYDTLYGERLTFYSDYAKLYEVDGKPVDIYGEYAFDCPFLIEKWKSGEVTIQFKEEKIIQKY